jgi:NADPH:quinone reductase-like Zn-dependent oxidoreductase
VPYERISGRASVCASTFSS